MKSPVRAFFVLWLAILAVSSAGAEGWQNVNPGGIHYAVERNALHPNRWRQELYQTPDCVDPCKIEFDDGVSAIYLRYKWMQINPAPGVYNFDEIGEILDQIRAHGKKVSLIVMAGKYTPEWVFENGAAHTKRKFNKSGKFTQRNAPITWDPIFIAAYTDMMDALSAYLRETPERYETIVLVKNGAMIMISGETRMMPPEEFLPKADLHDPKKVEKFRANLCADYAAAGYSEEKILETSKTVNARLSKAFPDMYLGMAFVAGSERFPTVDDSGKCTYPEKNRTLNKIVQQMAKTYGKRAIFNSTTLAGGGIGQPALMEQAKANGGQIAYQLNARRVGCRTPAAPCNRDEFEKAVQEGIDDGAVFIEIHDGDINRYKDLLPAMNRALLEN